MRTNTLRLLSLMAMVVLVGCQGESSAVEEPIEARHSSKDGQGGADNGETSATETAILGGGCFWCVESDFEKCPGVIDVVSGYSGGQSKSPNYEDYAAGGHVEVVRVTYDPSKVTFPGLVEWLIKHSDATDPDGSFADRGPQYRPIVFFDTEQQQQATEKTVEDVDAMGVYDKPIAIDIEPSQKFWAAEDYHQDYHTKSLIKYEFYRYQSGRDAFISKHWGDRASKLELPESKPAESERDPVQVKDQDGDSVSKAAGSESVSSDNESPKKPWQDFRKPGEAEMRRTMTPLQYQVTQEDGTEPPFDNEYWDNQQAGIYVDIVSGEPLFSSADQFHSGTGWPSFVQPLDAKFIKLQADNTLLSTRTEVRSKLADSHIGHVFNDGPPARGGKRYCLDSAALRFIPKDQMKAEGYAEYVGDAEKPQE